MKISVMITTRNRCQDLRRTLGVVSGMDPLPAEILVTADGCTDGTVNMVRRDFPNCRLHINEVGVGSVPARDRMMREAVGEVVISLDDDSYPVDKNFFANLPDVFIRHPEAGVITFPELLDNGKIESYHDVPPTTGHYVSSYSNCAAAVRRDVYIDAPGYSIFFKHAYEEPDFALQCYQKGYSVWFEPTLLIRHHRSLLNRDVFQTHQMHARNELWSVWMRCPWPWLPLVTLYRVWRQFWYSYKQGWDWLVREPIWWKAAARGVAQCRRRRCPIPWSRYYAWMRLARRSITNVDDLHRQFGGKPSR